MIKLQPVVLEGQHIQLEPLESIETGEVCVMRSALMCDFHRLLKQRRHHF